MQSIGIPELLTLSIVLAMFGGYIWWGVYVALKLRDIAARLAEMRAQHELESNALASIAASVARLVATEKQG